MNLAPIILFVYNRPEHTKQTIESLKNNSLACQSELFIYSDASKNKDADNSVSLVREYIDNIDGFKNITIIKRKKNCGLANSIIDGVSEIVNKYGKVIVLEDDLVTSPYFLKFMNDALNFYKDKEKVWHVSGWNYPIINDNLDDVFLWRLVNCWGWATWSDRWSYFEKNVEKTMKEFNKNDIKKLNLDNAENFYDQILLNNKKEINTWAIFWYVTIFKRNGLCLNPTQTFVKNIGHDGSGVHCGESKVYLDNLSINEDVSFISNFNENKIALERIKFFYKSLKKPYLIRIINKISRILFGKNLI